MYIHIYVQFWPALLHIRPQYLLKLPRESHGVEADFGVLVRQLCTKQNGSEMLCGVQQRVCVCVCVCV